MTSQRKTRQINRIRTRAAGRTLHVVDIENLVGTGAISPRDVLTARLAIEVYVGICETDSTLIAVSSGRALPSLRLWTCARCLVKAGPDGADHALLEALDNDVASRFAAVNLYSGDGIFTKKIASLASVGIRTTVVARRGALSRRLQMAAHHTIFLPAHNSLIAAMAV